MARRFLPGAIPVELPDAKAVAESVCSGAAAAAIAGDSTTHLSARQRPAGCELRVTPVPNARMGGGIAANPADAAAREAADLLREQLAAMAEDGAIASMSLRWQFPPTNEVLIMEHLAQARQAANLFTLVAVFAVLGSSLLVLEAIRLRQARRVAESDMSERSRFLAALSHEIRTPMGAIIGMAELALDTPLNAEQRDYLTTIRTSSTSLLSILNDTLDISKAEAGKLRLAPTEFRVRDGLADILQSLSFGPQEKGLELVCHVEPAVPDAVLCDAGRLRQILVNLAGNAIKFTDSGEVLVRVSVDPAGERPALRFVVADTGIGVPKERQESIFLPFEQGGAATQNTYDGTGLGLTISSRLVGLMGGRIWLESPWKDPLWGKHYTGSAFQFTVEVDLPPRTPPCVSSFKGTRALVVAVNTTQRRSLVEILRGWGMQADTADGMLRATEAMRAARAQGSPYGVAVLDLAEEACEIRRDGDEGDWAGACTVALSSAATRSQTAGAYGRLAAAHLLKPVKPTVMHSTIRALLDPATPSTGDLMHLTEGAGAGRPSAGSRRVLVAEDNLINQRLLRRLLEKRGHKVSTVSNGRDAILLLEQESADVVLMDVEMPVLDGLQATAELRSREKEGLPRVPIVAITAHALAG
ncbi:MAG: ATP-binding protein, partial [Bryobacteraceae bacterium]